MDKVWVLSSNILSPLGNTTEKNYDSIIQGQSGIMPHLINSQTIQASIMDKNESGIIKPGFSIFESLLIGSIEAAIRKTDIDPHDKRTFFIISSTKGNIDFIKENIERVNLFTSSQAILKYFGNPNLPIIISNACISGSLALLVGKRLINSGMADHVVAAGCDLVSGFVVSGFGCLQAISQEPCKPFDADRKGISLGEAAATIIISKDKTNSEAALLSGSTSNDANHISGPSRTGEELAMAVSNSLNEAELSVNDIDFISAHGTATLYNDEMEANALHLLKMNYIPVNSLKGYYGHTLGAAGLVEAALSLESMKRNELVPSLGFEHSGTTKSIQVIKMKEKRNLYNILKTASGFGGCNAALIFQKA